MLSTRKSWDLGHSPCLTEFWRRDVSLDASSLDFLMSDGEEDSSCLPLQSAAFPHQYMTADLPESSGTRDQQLLIQARSGSASPLALQDKASEIQARLHNQEASRRLQLQRLCQSHEQHLQDQVPAIHNLQDISGRQDTADVGHSSLGSRGGQEAQKIAKCVTPEQESKGRLQEDRLRRQESTQHRLECCLRKQVEDLKTKLQDQSQEVIRLRSELGATDLEKHLEILVSENERLKQELSACQASLLDVPAPTHACSDCPHSKDAEALRDQLVHLEEEIQEKDRQLAELERAAAQVAERERWLKESLHEKEEVEQQLSRRLRECQLALSQHAAQPPQIKYISKTVEVESAQSRKALQEAQAQNQALQEQLVAQRRLLRDLELQLHESQRVSSQLRTQLRADRSRLCGLLSQAIGKGSGEPIRRLSKILAYEGEMERAQGQLEAEMQNLEEEKNRIIEEAFVRAESEMKAVHENLAGVRMNLLTLQPALRTLTFDYNCLKRQVQDFPLMLKKAIAEAKQEICQVIGEVSSANQELLRKYKREMNLRKKCHNELVRLKGNIRVFCRVRPIGLGELDEAKSMVTFDPDDDAVLTLSNKGKAMTFELDKVFPPEATQEEVFQEVQSLITSCIDGYNVCIFAYGQTGSGKTYTMERISSAPYLPNMGEDYLCSDIFALLPLFFLSSKGIEDNPGINQRALRLLFSEVSEKAPDWDFNITVSMVEIYNETLRNLLGDNPHEKLDIKMCPDGSGQLYVPGLTEVTVQSVEDINKVFDLGHMNRATACTNLNEHSSRSHALLIITVAGFNASTGHRTIGKLNLVDLAGSERIGKSGAEGSRLREAQCINKSLSALGDVIHALRSKQGHIPFRNSRLTYLLQDSLSGDSKTLMMVQISPLESNVSESVCSLKFAQRVRTVELGGPTGRKLNENSSTSSSPTHDSLELDSPPVTPVPLPLSRASSGGSTLASSSRSTSSTRRRSHSYQSSVATCRSRLTPLSRFLKDKSGSLMDAGCPGRTDGPLARSSPLLGLVLRACNRVT
ncbi:kinesin-like protein KIFC3-like [Scleropages formosus]|uniref:Kinesin-like protein KIFC3-like n=1 Tax=Scleropages formosus TaxID=113540 RepID=A0A0P7VC16_SCLFO|nr:kinesin-like protein KIFC3-like [Scleropages formosus]